MLQFDRDSDNCVVIMYPTGGYGNFLYYLLSEHLANTVKIKQNNFEFSDSGNSHAVPKYTEIFWLGKYQVERRLKEFKYNYGIEEQYLPQVEAGAKFLVLGDMGNLADNVAFLRRYFPNATIIRTYAESFDEKVILWANCVNKSYNLDHDPIYKDSLHTASGIAQFCNKSVDQITDQDAVDCMLNFFATDFDPFGQFFNSPVDGVVNIPLHNFFTKDSLLEMCLSIANQLDTHLIRVSDLASTIDNFLNRQYNLTLITSPTTDTLAGHALQLWNKHKDTI